MPTHYSRIFEFWKELKRRKVIQVITVYAASAFVILELVDILAPSLRLPDWTLNLVLLLLCVGFVIAVILSWIYDKHPEGGIVKTEPADKVKPAVEPKSSNSWKIASYISFVVIVGLIVLNIIPRSTNKKILEKSIAVLPFINESSDSEYTFFIYLTMGAILDNLCKIEDLRAPGLHSVEQYRNSLKPIPEITKELNVNYILEGSGQKLGDRIILTIRLLDGIKDRQLWSKRYDREIRIMEDMIDIQSEVAQLVAAEIEAVITPEEKELIESIPTTSLDAYEYYFLGQHYINNFSQDEDFWKAIEHYQQAVELDSTFAEAYSGLADVYCQLADFAILSPNEAYSKAKAYALSASELNEKLGIPHCFLGRVKECFEYDFAGAEKEYLRALELSPNSYLAHQYYANYLSMMGRHDEAILHADLALELDPLSYFTQTTKYYTLFNAGYKSEALELTEKARDSDPDNTYFYWLCAVFYTDLGMFNEALSMLMIQMPLMENGNISDEIGLLGYIYGQLNQKDKAQEQLARLDELTSEGFYVSPRTLVWIYLGINDLDKANEILEQSFEDHNIDPGYLVLFPRSFINYDPRIIELQRRVGLRK